MQVQLWKAASQCSLTAINTTRDVPTSKVNESNGECKPFALKVREESSPDHACGVSLADPRVCGLDWLRGNCPP